jgi:peptidyl-dipeptidase Dcp
MKDALLSPSTLAYGAVPFNQITVEDFEPAFSEGIAKAKERLQTIISNPATPNFENTLVALEHSSEELDRASSVFFNLLSCEAGEELHALAQKVSPLLAQYQNDVALNETLFKRIKAVVDSGEASKLSAERKRLLDKVYKSFVRNGALLSDADKDKLRAIDEEASQLWPKFSENLLKATNGFELYVENDSALKEMPESALENARAKAEKKGKAQGYLFGLDGPTYIAFMTYCTDSKLRETMWRAFGSRGLKDPHDNRALVKRIVELREARAKLLGFAHHAAYVLEERMAGSPEKVTSFLRALLKVARPAAEKELAQVRKLKSDLAPWDFAYFSEKLKQQELEFDEEKLRPFFSLPSVVEGVFEHARKLYGLEFRKLENVPVYHKDVEVYEVLDQGGSHHVGLLYADFYPRETKKNGAWMTSYRDQHYRESKRVSPLVSIVCNFTKPSLTKPSLLTFDEVLTLFHEFGHALHALLSDTEFPSLSGPNVYWDFVELPSQIMENWAYQKEALQLFAKHYQTGESLSEDLLDKLKALKSFQAGYSFVRQIQFGLLDMAWHSTQSQAIQDVEAFEREITEETRLFPPQVGTGISCSFSHIFSGGYAAGYYSYKWAEVLDADAFEYFLEKGLFNGEVAKAFRQLLSKGGSEDPAQLYKKFRGRDPDPQALLRRASLI